MFIKRNKGSFESQNAQQEVLMFKVLNKLK